MDNKLQLVVIVCVILLLIFGAIYVYSHGEIGTGVVDTKWVESSCDSDGNCSQTYYVQLKDGRIYTMLWATLDYDRLQSGSKIEFTARGMRMRIFGWRLMVPTIVKCHIAQ